MCQTKKLIFYAVGALGNTLTIYHNLVRPSFTVVCNKILQSSSV
jgi:hypothetical protein